MTKHADSVDFNSQADPMRHLLLNATATQDMELQIQSGVSQVLQAWSEGASNSISAGDMDLTSIAQSMTNIASSASGSDEANQLAIANAKYNTAQTRYSNINNQYSNIMQGGGTIVTSLTQVQQQSLGLCQITVDFMNSLNQLIMNFG